MSEIKTLSDQELVHDVLRTERTLVGNRFQHSLGQLENTSKLGDLRKRIARLRTELRSRELAQGLRKDGLMQAHRGSFVVDGEGASTSAVSEKGGFLSGVVDKLTGNE